jgi:hypothetical protein
VNRSQWRHQRSGGFYPEVSISVISSYNNQLDSTALAKLSGSAMTSGALSIAPLPDNDLYFIVVGENYGYPQEAADYTIMLVDAEAESGG